MAYTVLMLDRFGRDREIRGPLSNDVPLDDHCRALKAMRGRGEICGEHEGQIACVDQLIAEVLSVRGQHEVQPQERAAKVKNEAARAETPAILFRVVSPFVAPIEAESCQDLYVRPGHPKRELAVLAKVGEEFEVVRIVKKCPSISAGLRLHLRVARVRELGTAVGLRWNGVFYAARSGIVSGRCPSPLTGPSNDHPTNRPDTVEHVYDTTPRRACARLTARTTVRLPRSSRGLGGDGGDDRAPCWRAVLAAPARSQSAGRSQLPGGARLARRRADSSSHG